MEPKDLLWSDPMDQLGRLPSPRGGGVLFGPDVTERALEVEDKELFGWVGGFGWFFLRVNSRPYEGKPIFFC